MIARIRDWLHEREIARLSAACGEAMQAGDKAKARHFCDALMAALKGRSTGQVERMERRIFDRMSVHDQRIFLKHSGRPGTR